MTTIGLSEARRAAITAWLVSNNIDPDTVPLNAAIIENQTIGTIRYTAFVNQAGPARPGENVIQISNDDMYEWREVPLLVAAPEFPA